MCKSLPLHMYLCRQQQQSNFNNKDAMINSQVIQLQDIVRNATPRPFWSQRNATALRIQYAQKGPLIRARTGMTGQHENKDHSLHWAQTSKRPHG